MSGRLRAGGAFGHLLLVVVLSLGVFAMHTMGHPEESSGHGMSGTIPAVASAYQGGMAREAAAAEAPAQTEAMAEHGSAAPAATLPVHEMPSGTDVMSVCVAVLTVWLLGLFLRAAVAGRQARLTALIARSMVQARPSIPPPRPLLSRLSVLRI
ncbi:hypothetical protein GCM10009601_04560 [Streptomyces thermospinosisporus]|uniref:Uncharacterized protein n=1 Tax=Streptomyces thermospinosisporus TaxID=161482 RepID=A0ABP4JBG4_9ACTN